MIPDQRPRRPARALNAYWMPPSVSLIRMHPDPADRQATLLRLSPAGADFVSSVLSDAQVERASSILRLVTHVAER